MKQFIERKDCAHEKTALRILVVEDNADCAATTAALLRLYGHTVDVAGDGVAALRSAKQYHPDVVLLDIGLPGMSGWDVAKHLKGKWGDKEPLLIAVTGFGQAEDHRHSQEAGIDLHWTKPVDPQTMEAVLKRFQAIVC